MSAALTLPCIHLLHCPTDVSDTQEQDPLADATYIRANFTYVPRTPKELQIKAGDVFHIHDEVYTLFATASEDFAHTDILSFA